MSGFRSLANFDHWPVGGGGGWESLRPKAVQSKPKLNKAAHAKLSKVIEADIIPKLLLAHDVSQEQPASVTADDVIAFSRYLLRGDGKAAAHMITALRRRGTPISGIFLELFTPSARLLGELWNEDICDFTDVTLALSQMQQMLRDLAPEFYERVPHARPRARRALLIAAPGDDHGFGIQIIREFFRRAGWEVTGEPASYDALLRCTRLERFDVVGLSFTNDTPVDGLAAIIRAIRKSAVDSDLKVMVGGRLFLEHPEFVRQVGADATAPDGRRAVPRISSLLDTSAWQC
ncbi:MAG: cobalamin-dependent protein [Hyphomicrobiaceae bacterium]|nr:cobalamin-dependent protein [Hyphomicrobiaceae bacterium]